MDGLQVDEYLGRIGAERSTPLAELQRLHLERIPFENLSIHLGEPIELDEGSMFDKLVTRHRGGFCYELNGLFGILLEALGARVELCGAQVFGREGDAGPPLDHLALLVAWPGSVEHQLADVGFGRFTTYPLRWHDRGVQSDPAGSFRLVDTADGCVDVLADEVPQVRVDPRPRRLVDFVPMCWWQQTSPSSHFTRSTMCSRLDADGRITLSGSTLIRTVGGRRTEEPLADDDAVLAAYRDHFGVVLDRVPVVKFP